MRINSVGKTGPFCCNNNQRLQHNKVNALSCQNTNFKGKLSGNMYNDTTREVLEIVGISTIPVIFIMLVNNFFKNKKDEHKEHIFLNDGTYLGHTDDFFQY